MANALSNLAKRQAAISGRATTGDVPELYALQDAMARESAAQMGGTPGLGAGEGAGAPIPTGAGGSGAVGGQADLGLPGQGFANPELERLYTRAFRSNEMMGGEGPDRADLETSVRRILSVLSSARESPQAHRLQGCWVCPSWAWRTPSSTSCCRTPK